jgi:hypothetical protein
MPNPASLLLTAIVSLAIGAGGTYALVRVSSTCSVTQTTRAPAPPPVIDHFMDAPAPRVGGGPRY